MSLWPSYLCKYLLRLSPVRESLAVSLHLFIHPSRKFSQWSPSCTSKCVPSRFINSLIDVELGNQPLSNFHRLSNFPLLWVEHATRSVRRLLCFSASLCVHYWPPPETAHWDEQAFAPVQQDRPFQSKVVVGFLPKISVELPRPINSKRILFLIIGIILLVSVFCNSSSFPVY